MEESLKAYKWEIFLYKNSHKYSKVAAARSWTPKPQKHKFPYQSLQQMEVEFEVVTQAPKFPAQRTHHLSLPYHKQPQQHL